MALETEVNFGGPIVRGRGDKNARLAFIGEAPGEEELRTGKPFIGPSGALLANLLSHNQILDSQVWIDNVLQTKPKNRNPNFDEIKQAIPGLRQRLRDLPNLTCIVPVGGVALQALSVFQYTKITDYRGSVLNARLLNKKMVPILHPAFIMKDGWRENRFTHVSIGDIARAVEESQQPERILPIRNHRILYHIDEIIQALRGLRDREFWSFDVETSLPCLGFSSDPLESFTIPFQGLLCTIDQKQRFFIIEELKKVFTHEAKIICQNGIFDWQVLWRDYGIDPGSWHIYADTMYLHQLLYPELPHSLAFICSVYTREPFYKSEGREWIKGKDDEAQYFRYNGKDCCVTLESFFEMAEEARECNQYDYFQNVIMAAIPILFRMHVSGVHISQPNLETAKAYLNRIANICRIRTIRSLGFEVNPRSPLDMEFFLSEIGVKEKDIQRSEKTGKVKTDEDYLKQLYHKCHRPEILELLRLRGAQHLLSGFTNITTDGAGRFHAIFKPGPKSGRLACTGDGNGPQLQNIPVQTKQLNLRSVFAAPPGRVLIKCDYEQADTRALAYIAPEPMLIGLFESEDSDIHSQVCHQVIIPHVPREEIFKGSQWDKERKIAKETGHGTNYGMGPRKLVHILWENDIFITERDAKNFQAAYFARFPNLKHYHGNIQTQVRNSRTVYDLNGRRHVFLGFLDDTLFREAYSRPPQATVAGLMLRGMVRLQRRFDETDWEDLGYQEPLILMQIHDELVIECDLFAVVLVAKMIQEALLIPLNAHGREFIIPMEMAVGETWGTMEKLKLG
jgi:uracil-DNA glycosylase family 4